jgi:large subunit ribosomal protein L15
MISLDKLSKRKGNHKPSKRLGRGIGSGKGVRSSYGNKGAKARSGRTKAVGFEGGQTPLYKRLPKFKGFKPINRKLEATVSLAMIEKNFSSGDTVDVKKLQDLNIISKNCTSYKIVSSGTIEKNLIIIGKTSKSAKLAIENKGGRVEEVLSV